MIENLILNSLNITLFITSYLIGSIPTGFIIFKYIRKQDIRSYGSGNIGATNVNRLLGRKLGLLTLFFDFLKTFIPCLVIHMKFGTEVGVISGFLTILGHMFPIWLRFRGGKGVASYLGFISVTSWPLCFIFLFVWLIIVKLFKYSALGAISAVLISMIGFTLILYLQFNFNIYLWIPGDPVELKYFLIISILILIKHLKNIKFIFKF